jgi:hypothetical protein
MKTLLTLALILCSLPAQAEQRQAEGHELGSGKQGRAYLCDDGIFDSGYSAEVLLSDGSFLAVTIFQKTKSERRVRWADTLAFKKSAGKFRSYSNDAFDARLDITISSEDFEGKRVFTGEFHSKLEQARIPAQGNMLCYPVKPAK